MTVKIIAELCQNHNGNQDLLWKLMEASKNNGATHAKIQNLYSFELTKRMEFEVQRDDRFSMYRPFDKEFDRLVKLDLNFEVESEFVSRCLALGLIPMTTVFTLYGVQRALEAGFRTIKIPSYGSTDIDLILAAEQFADEIVISTGATTMLEIECVIHHLKTKIENPNLYLLHCRTEYPNVLERVQLSRMLWLRKSFGFPVGFSDHSARVNIDGKLIKNRLLPIKVALWLGAEVIEKHFTVLSHGDSKDGRISANESDLREISRFSILSSEEMHEELKDEMDLVEEIVDINNKNFEPTVEEWFNRRYYKGRVKTL